MKRLKELLKKMKEMSYAWITAKQIKVGDTIKVHYKPNVYDSSKLTVYTWKSMKSAIASDIKPIVVKDVAEEKDRPGILLATHVVVNKSGENLTLSKHMKIVRMG